MDGNEKNLLVPRAGIGDSRTSRRGGFSGRTTRGGSMIGKAGIVTPSVRKSSNIFMTAKKKVEAKKAKEADTTLKTMMHRMNQGKRPDEDEETTDSGLDEYLEGWLDRDLNTEDPDPEYMAEEQDFEIEISTGNGQDGQEASEARDYRVSNDFQKASTLQTSTETNRNLMFNGIDKETTRNSIAEFTEAPDRNIMTNGTMNGITRNTIGITETTTNGTAEERSRAKGGSMDEEIHSGQLDSTNMDETRYSDDATINNGMEGYKSGNDSDLSSGNEGDITSLRKRSIDSTKTTTTIHGIERTDRTKEQTQSNLATGAKGAGSTNEKEGTQNHEKTGRAKSLGVSTGRGAKEMRLETEALKVGPGLGDTPESSAPTQKIYTYHMQVSFSQPLDEDGTILKKGNYHVPTCFKHLVKQLNSFSPAITVLPYNTNGVPITSSEQLPDNEIEDYIVYYHNHHVTAGGQLTGMCCIETPFTWNQLKDDKKTLFKWLKDKRVFMKYVSFKADQVSAAGWFYNMNPDVLKSDEAAGEIRKRLGTNLPEDLSIQMVPRMLSITDKITRNRFSFKGVAIECERNRVKELQEALYTLASPEKARFEYGITGGALFVPFIENDVWKNDKILGMAKAHVQEMNKLGQIFLQNVQNIDENLLWRDGEYETLRTMLTNCTTVDGHRMIHSIHKTNREGTISVLYYKEYMEEINHTFPDIQDILERQLAVESRGMIATAGSRIVMTGRQTYVASSNASKAYSSYADIILASMNPQGGDGEEEDAVIKSPPRKKQTQRRTPPRMTYSQITKPKRNRTEERETNKMNAKPTTDSEDSIQEETPKENDSLLESLQERFEKMQEQFESQFGRVVETDMETTNKLIEENNKKMQKISEEYFEKKFQELSVNLTKEIERSNALIFDKFAALTAQQNTALLSLQETMKQEIQKVYIEMANLQAGKPIDNTALQTRRTVATPSKVPLASDGEP